MKTVMKKMFCLMLVAVLMVGVMPFQAFAAELATTAHMNIGSNVDTVAANRDETWTSTVNDIIVQWFGMDPALFSNATIERDGAMDYSAGLTTEVKAGDTIHIRLFETAVPEKCDNCGNDKHEGVCCSKCKVTGHADVNHCTYCNSLEHLSTTHCSVCEEIGCDSSKHCSLCESKEHTASLHCSNCGVLGHLAAEHCTVCNEYGCSTAKHCGVCADKAHTTANCPYCAVCYAKGDKQVTSHATAAHCTTCDTVNGHKSGYPCYTAPATGSANLYIWANLYTGSVKTGTVLLDTITGLSGSDLVYQVVTNNKGRIESKIPAGYTWTGHVYYEQDPKTTLTVKSTLTVGSEDDAVINLYTNQKLVVARVHTSKSFAVDHTIDINGFVVGQTITSNDVLKAVKNHYNVSTLKMYTPSEWEKVAKGGNGAVIPNYEVHNGDNIIDVYVTGSYKGNTTTHKADSSNPKTGDEIFVPMTVLFASVSSLAVLYYLNKKRAF